MVVTRFAPSPTGFLHIGGARTALFNYLFARHHGGKFLLRIEDTDKTRSTTEAKNAILNGLHWLGLNWDGEEIYQSSREERHREAAITLLENGNAYYCFCRQEEVNNARDEAMKSGKPFLFESPWRDADPSSYPKDQKAAIRLKVPKTGITTTRDLVQGDVLTDNAHIDDLILLRSDGTPTYMLAVVVDDHDMGVTHIIRGDDHLTNTPKQILLYEAFGWDVPSFSHIPLIHGPDGAKLSKRHGAVGIEWYKNAGYLPEAMCNYLMRLGWSHGNEEIISMEDAIKWFDVKQIGKSPSRLDFAKMNNVNAHYIKSKDNDYLSNIVIESLKCDEESASYIRKGMESLKLRAQLLTDLTILSKIYLVDRELEISEEAKKIIDDTDKSIIDKICKMISELSVTNHDDIQEKFKELAEKNGLKLGELMKPARALITGSTASPSVFEIISIIGKDNSLQRLKKIWR